MTGPTSLTDVDWSKIPPPEDDGGTQHLLGTQIPPVTLVATDGREIALSALPGRVVLFAYPMTGRPGVALPEGWDFIPGARGCTPQACAFRDLEADLKAAGADHLFGISTQNSDDQREATSRLHLPFPLLSDAGLAFARTLKLPTFDAAGRTLLKRLALIADDGRIMKVFYPVFPPDRNAPDVLDWLRGNPR
jgi:peroxiredoxin